MNDLVFDNLKKILEDGRPCPYYIRDDNWDTYCSTFVDCDCGYQGRFAKDRNKITYRICKRDTDGLG